jgi:DHA1 family bicyclomycin/chloramphenicol resistance-like MFS transporter
LPVDTPLKPPPSGRLIATVLGQLAFGLFAMTICLPSMQEWGAIFDVAQPAVQLTFSGYVLTYGALQLVYGPLSDRIGRKRVLLMGMGLAFVGSFAAAIAPNLTLLTWARVFQGAGAAAGMVVGRAMVQDLFDGPDRTRVMAYVGMAMGLCPPLATILGGQLHVHFGWRANFIFITLIAAWLLYAAWRELPALAAEAVDRPHWLGSMLTSYATLMRTPSFMLYVAVLATATATFYIFLGGAPVVLGSYGVGPDGIGFYIMVIPLSYITGSFLTSRVIRRFGNHRMMEWGQRLTVGGMVLVVVLALTPLASPLALVLPLILLGIGHGFLVPPALTGTVGLIPALAGAAAAVAGVSQQVMGAFGGYVVGLVPLEGALNLGWLMLLTALLGYLAHRYLLRQLNS